MSDDELPWDEAWDPRRVWWQEPPSLMWRVEVARRNLRDARRRAAEKAAADAELRGWLRRVGPDREAYNASPEGKAAAAAADAAWEEEKRKSREKAHAADVMRRKHRLPAWAAWAAWQIAVNKRTQRAVGEELGGVAGSVIGKGIEDYLYLHHPEVTPAWYGTGNCPLEGARRRNWLRQHFADKHEPVFPGHLVQPADAMPRPPANTKEYPQYYKARNAWIYRQRLAGRTLQQIADDVGIVRDRIRQICETQEGKDERRAREWRRPKPWRTPRNPGRPIDMGGPRDVWLTYGVPADPRLDNVWPVRP